MSTVEPPHGKTTSKVGFYTALSTAVLTVVTFGIALNTPPLSGPFCVEGCIEYPYVEDIAARFPRDYLWMYPAILLICIYVVLMACIHRSAAEGKKLFSLLSLSFALISATLLMASTVNTASK